MSYVLKSNIKRKGIGMPIKVLSAIVILIVILHLFLPNLLPTIFTTIAKPFWSLGMGDKPDMNTFSSGTENSVITQLQKENIELKDKLGRSTSKNTVLAYILKKPPITVYDTFILDIGSNSGVSVNDKVYSFGDILIGEIMEVSPTVSKVKLYSSFGEKYNVLIGDKNVQATATGRGGGAFELIIPRDIKVTEGDTITIPNISNSVFGTVAKIISEPARAFSTVIFSQPINIYEQKWVIVSLTNPKK